MPVRRRIVLFASAWLVAAAPSAADGQNLLWQLNSAGDDIHVVDAADGSVVRRIAVGPEPHGIATPADHRVVYVTLEANGRAAGELLWIDPSTFEVTHRLEVGPEPHEIATTPDGRWIYVPCRDGHYWVVDARRREVVKRIYTGGRPHNTKSSRDGRFMYLSPMGAPERVTVVDVEAGHEVVGHIDFRDSVRPSALADSRGLFFQQVDGLHGFQVADVARRRVVATVEHRGRLGWLLLPIKKLGWLGPEGLQRCHGLEVRPGEDEIWSTCGERANVHALDETGFPQAASIELPSDGYWVTFSPDGRYAFVALTEEDRVAVVDAERREIVRYVRVGDGPKRNLVLPRAAPFGERAP